MKIFMVSPEDYAVKPYKIKGAPISGETPCWVYGLFVDTDKCIYIGQTTTTIERRIGLHMQMGSAKGSDIQKYIWACTIVDKDITIRVLEKNAIWDVTETHWIEKMISEGHNLRNMRLTPDGDHLGRCQSDLGDDEHE